MKQIYLIMEYDGLMLKDYPVDFFEKKEDAIEACERYNEECIEIAMSYHIRKVIQRSCHE